MKAIRVVLFVLVVAAAGFLAFRGIGGAKTGPAPAPDATPVPAPGGDEKGKPAFPETGPERAPAAPPTQTPKAEAAAPDVVDPTPGTPVAAGASADVVVPYRTGTKSRYRVSDGQKAHDLSTDGVMWREFEWFVTTEVVQGDGTGPARIRLTLDDFTFKTQTPNFPVMFRAKEPMTALLENEEFARSLKPQMAILGVPVEFSIGAGGAVTGVEGVDGLSRKFLAAVEELGPKYMKDTPDAPTAESLTQTWTEFLFPPTGGGTLAAGATRDAKFHLVHFERWDCVSAGKFRLTHADEGGFRLEFKGKPDMEELSRAVKSQSAAGIEKMRVVSSADSYVGAWRFDRTAGRLVRGSVHAKYRIDVSRRTGAAQVGQPQFDARFTNVERRIVTELLDK
jgi:hypothetical protein